MNKKLTLRVVILIIAFILVLLAGIAIGANSFRKEKENVVAEEGNVISNDELRAINFYEEFSKIGTVENLKDVIWNSARITQIDNKMQVELVLINQSKDKKIGETNITVNLADKNGKIILTKDAKINEIKPDYGQTTVNLEIDIEEITVIYNMQVVANIPAEK